VAALRLIDNAARSLEFKESSRQCLLEAQFAAVLVRISISTSIELIREWASWQVSELLALFPAASPSNQADYSQIFFAHNLATRHVSDPKAMLGASLHVCNVMKRLVGRLRCSCHCTVLVISTENMMALKRIYLQDQAVFNTTK
jgi:hypothetical protein